MDNWTLITLALIGSSFAAMFLGLAALAFFKPPRSGGTRFEVKFLFFHLKIQTGTTAVVFGAMALIGVVILIYCIVSFLGT